MSIQQALQVVIQPLHDMMESTMKPGTFKKKVDSTKLSQRSVLYRQFTNTDCAIVVKEIVDAIEIDGRRIFTHPLHLDPLLQAHNFRWDVQIHLGRAIKKELKTRQAKSSNLESIRLESLEIDWDNDVVKIVAARRR